MGELKAGGAAKRGKDERSLVQRSWPPTTGEEADERVVVGEGEQPWLEADDVMEGKGIETVGSLRRCREVC